MGGGDDDPIATRTRSRNRLRLLPLLPEEIIVEILLRLPVRSLLQFKCVCKTWKTLISDPQFAKTHILSSTPSLQLISVVPGLANCRLLSYPLEPLLEIPSTCVKPVILHSRYNNNTRILGSCNGLLCLHDFPQSEFRLLNPSINFQSKTSPTIVCFDHKFIIYRGFGYDQVNDRYKVLVVVQNAYNLDEIKTIIYTFGENSWTTVQNFPFDWRRDRDSHMWLGKFVSGTLNWIVNNNKDGVNSNSTNQEVIISFDLEKETYGEVLLPQYDGNNVRNPVLYVSSDCICVCFDHSKEKSWVVWMMKEYGVVESWTKLMIIPQKKLISDDIPRRPLFNALLMSENGVFLLITKHSKHFLYNFNNGRLDFRRNFVNFVCDLHIYQESLISPQWCYYVN